MELVLPFELDVPDVPYFSGSRIPVTSNGTAASFTLSAVGGGAVSGSLYVAPRVATATTTTLIGATQGAIAVRTVRIVPPPSPSRALIAVASYRCGIALHDPKSFALLGCAGIGGAPGDVGFLRDGTIIAPQTDGETLVRVERAPWRMTAIAGVLEGNELIAPT